MNSYSIKELYQFTPDVESKSSGRLNPLTEKGSLNAAEFVEMRISTQRSRVGIIFDIRGLSFEGSNTALLVLTGVEKARWDNDRTQHPWTARRGNWEPTASVRTKPPSAWEVAAQGGWALDAAEAPTATAADTTTPEYTSQEGPMSAPADSPMPPPKSEGHLIPDYTLDRTGTWDRLTASGLRAEIYIGHVEGMDGPPPDMEEEPDSAIIAGFPQWSSVMTVHEHYSYPASNRSAARAV